jgi:hypothetical protein
VIVFAALPLQIPDPSTWIRVDDPDYPSALARSSTGSVLAEVPTDGTRWRPETVPELDVVDPADLGEPGVSGAPDDFVALTNADLWHADGVRGAGVKVAVFDLAWFADVDRSIVEPYVTHDCFVTPSCESPFDELRPHNALEGGVHGWACAETIRRLAPEAELHLVRVDSMSMYENAIEWAVREGIDIVSMSMSFYNDSFYDGSGPHERLTVALEQGGGLLVSSAGNDAVLTWTGPWVDRDGDGRLDGDGDNGLFLYLDRPGGINLTWNQWGLRCGDTDLDLRVYDGRGYEIGRSDDAQDRDGERYCEPVDIVSPHVFAPDWYRIEVHRLRGAQVGLDLSMISRSGQWLEPTPSGSIVDPHAHPLAVAVGAVRTGDYWNGPPEYFSSYGPTRLGVQKPEIMGPDGLSVTSYGPIGFYGTSASAPAVAGLVALVMSDDPELTSRQAFERLQGWAHRPTPTLEHPEIAYGAGMARLPVRDPGPGRCGERPLWAGLLLPLWLVRPWRRARTER